MTDPNATTASPELLFINLLDVTLLILVDTYLGVATLPLT